MVAVYSIATAYGSYSGDMLPRIYMVITFVTFFVVTLHSATMAEGDRGEAESFV